MRFSVRIAALAMIGLAASCAPPPAPRPAPRPAPPPSPRPAPPPPAPAPQTTDWRDIPLTAGDWRYEGGEAVFVMAGGVPGFILRCDRGARRVELRRPAGGGSQIRLRTSSSARNLAGNVSGAGVSVSLPVSDPLLDAIAFSRGRFTVESDSGAMLVLPAWPEPARVVEDCRD